MKYHFRMGILSLFVFRGLLGGELELGSDIPKADIKMQDISKKEISLKDAMGPSGLLVVFSCNTCPWVDAWEDRYSTIAADYGPKGIGIIALNSNEASRDRGESIQDMRARAERLGYDFHYVVDEDSRLARAFGATRTPHIFLFDKKGELVYRGAIDDNAREPENVSNAYLMNAMDEILAGKPVSVTSTKAFGCSIKFAEK